MIMTDRSNSVIICATGYLTGEQSATNLGDAAQQLRAMQVLGEILPNHFVVALANSSKEKPLSRLSYRFLTGLPAYLGTSPSTAVGKAVLVTKVVWIIINAFLKRLSGKSLMLPADLMNVLDQISRSRMLFLCGSGTINQKYLTGPAGLWILTAVVARIAKTPIVLLGQQIGPWKNTPFNRVLLQMAFGSALYVGCRDEESVKLARAMGLRSDALQFSGDEGAYLLPAPWQEGRRILDELGYQPGYIAVHFRIDGNSHFYEWLKWYAEIVDRIALDIGASVLFVPMAYRGPGDDRRAISELEKFTTCQATVLDCEDPAVLKAILAFASVSIGVANHFVAFAASVGVPTIGIHSTEYMRQKLEGAAKLYQQVKSLPVGEMDPEGVAALAKAMAKDRGTCDEMPSFTPGLPVGYWGWLDRLDEIGIATDRSGLPFAGRLLQAATVQE